MRSMMVLLALVALPAFAAGDTSIEGIQIGDTSKVLERLGQAVAIDKRGDIEFRKYKTAEGNDLSVTLKKDRVLFIENDWSQDDKSTKAPYDGWVFGKTSLNEVRSRFGSNGFTYEKIAFPKTGAGLVTFNCYELPGNQPTVLVVVTKLLPKPGITASNIGNHFKLDAVIIADPTFLDEIWGNDKKYDPAYKQESIAMKNITSRSRPTR